jgi:hypothetical protein
VRLGPCRGGLIAEATSFYDSARIREVLSPGEQAELGGSWTPRRAHRTQPPIRAPGQLEHGGRQVDSRGVGPLALYRGAAHERASG